jgi:hypothetical protein
VAHGKTSSVLWPPASIDGQATLVKLNKTGRVEVRAIVQNRTGVLRKTGVECLAQAGPMTVTPRWLFRERGTRRAGPVSRRTEDDLRVEAVSGHPVEPRLRVIERSGDGRCRQALEKTASDARRFRRYKIPPRPSMKRGHPPGLNVLIQWSSRKRGRCISP